MNLNQAAQGTQPGKYVVLGDHTLGYRIAETPGMMGVLAGSVIKGGHDWKNGPVSVTPSDVLRAATRGDFDTFRVEVPADFVEPVSAPEIRALVPDGAYVITLGLYVDDSVEQLCRKLQAAYDAGAAGSFAIKVLADSGKYLEFKRVLSDDYDMLAARLAKGSELSRAACEQLADEFEELSPERDALAAVVAELRAMDKASVIGLAVVATGPRFRIRNFGTDTECADAASLEVAIQQYRGKSVSIVSLHLGGATLYVDVSESGELTESYGARRKLTIAERFGGSDGTSLIHS